MSRGQSVLGKRAGRALTAVILIALGGTALVSAARPDVPDADRHAPGPAAG